VSAGHARTCARSMRPCPEGPPERQNLASRLAQRKSASGPPSPAAAGARVHALSPPSKREAQHRPTCRPRHVIRWSIEQHCSAYPRVESGPLFGGPAYGPPGGWGCLCGTHQAVSLPQNSMPRSRQPTHARPAPPPEPMHPPQTSSGSIVWAWGVGRAGAGREGRRVHACMHGVGWGEKASCSPSLSRKNRRTRSRPRRQMVGGPPPSAPRSPHQGRPPWPCLAPGRG